MTEAKWKYGWKRSLPDHRDFLFKYNKDAIFPTKVDLREQIKFPVYDQGQLGSCTGNGLGFSVEFSVNKDKKEPDFMPSRLFIYFNERKLEGTIKEDAGAEIKDGIKTLVNEGVCTETMWPYIVEKFAKKPSTKCYKQALTNIVEKYEKVVDLQGFKAALAAGYPIVFGFTVYESFESDKVAETGVVPVPAKNEEMLGGHCVAAVGYDDSKNCLICRNSWGPEWGDKGYFYLPYEFFNLELIADCWVIYTVKA